MRIQVRLFAILRERAAAAEIALDLPASANVATAVDQITARFPEIRDLVRKAAFAVNREYAAADRILREGDELALIPAVSGGCPAR